MDKIFYNKEYSERFGTLFSKIITYANKINYDYFWYTVEDQIPPKPLPIKENWENAFLDSWVKTKKGLWISDVEDDYKDDPEFRKVLVNNLINFDRKLKLEKLLS